MLGAGHICAILHILGLHGWEIVLVVETVLASFVSLLLHMQEKAFPQMS